MIPILFYFIRIRIRILSFFIIPLKKCQQTTNLNKIFVFVTFSLYININFHNFFFLNQCCGLEMFFPDPGIDFFSIPDPNRLQPGSRILIKDLSNLSPKKAKKWFISSKTYHPGGSFRLPQSKWHPIPDLGPWIRYISHIIEYR